MRTVDRFNDQIVSAYICPSGARLLLLHGGHNEDAIGAFFKDVHELLAKQLLNPFQKFDAPIVSEVFDKRVRAIAKHYF